MSDPEIQAFFAPVRTGVLTTLDAGGWPHSTAMWFAPGSAEILMWTYGKSQKAVNVRRDDRVAFLVEEGLAYDKLKGVCVRGHARVIENAREVAAIGEMLYRRYTDPGAGAELAPEVKTEIERQAGKRIGIAVPLEDVASWDHTKLGGS